METNQSARRSHRVGKWQAKFNERGDSSTMEITYEGKAVILLSNLCLDERDLFGNSEDLVKLLNDSHAYLPD